jgi:hypothetical protein
MIHRVLNFTEADVPAELVELLKNTDSKLIEGVAEEDENLFDKVYGRPQFHHS